MAGQRAVKNATTGIWRRFPEKLNLDDQLRVLPQLFIGSEQMQRLTHCLRDEQTVKRIGVIHRQLRDKHCMARKDGQLMKTVHFNLIEELPWIGFYLSQTNLDRDLPDGS